MRILRLIALTGLLSIVLLMAGIPSRALAQSSGGRIAFGANFGLSKYWGSFTDDQFWLGGDIGLRWNIVPWLSMHGQFGITQLRYQTTNQNQPDYFGTTGVYPGNPTVRVELKNSIRTNTYSTFFSINLTPSEVMVPYIFGGVGYMNFQPRNIGQDAELPNAQAGKYEKNAVIFPFGVGTELYVSDNFTLNARAQMNLTGTDFLDDYQDSGATANDAFATFTVGFGVYIFGSLDCDKDGLTDSEERRIGSDPCNPDTDGDGLTDFEEVRTYKTDPTKPDTDSDGLNDYQEVKVALTDPRNPDTDSDGLKDGEEVNARKTNPLKPDTDGDGLTDGDEVNKYKTDPLKTDTDNDGLTDGSEVTVYNTNPTAQDTDNDKLTDGEEVNSYKTNPVNPDTDGDGLKDGEEVKIYKTDPNKADTDNDKLTDGEEVQRVKTNPLNPDTDGDRVIDGDDKCPLVPGVVERQGCPAPPKVGTITDFPEIYFIVNTDQFDFSRPETDQNLVKLLAYVKQCPGLGVIIEGHASREGNDKRNQELSDMRAKKVKDWLIERGADSRAIEATIGYGSRKNKVQEPDPNSAAAKKMDPTALENMRKQNRRIAVKVARTCD
jgi:outer membrane protein OmpA-like peptidoglycan-associated protein/opacity protein-like surface antigen